jgi:hypothetical protein
MQEKLSVTTQEKVSREYDAWKKFVHVCMRETDYNEENRKLVYDAYEKCLDILNTLPMKGQRVLAIHELVNTAIEDFLEKMREKGVIQ